ncbi:hypothetical protein L873DRAFT_1828469 [Choiromyces venosus 120613-1]|uniref:ZZ-type domain-containing protein n=1 Tax=Choiromyces venosus 120613-1 TaxID=1336337 RepID=A0A3N4JK44_9PEZI|nr:hypothetical protein L873DRAFT_1828469 [Choiromyces venosus 120613-1]
MASHGAVHPDTAIKTKVTFNGNTRCFKLVLRDLGANVLLPKLRTLLAIPEDKEVTFERYSDSAGGYVVLDTAEPTAFKQLYRAARAKLKLRIQATIVPAKVPAPVVVDPSSSTDTLTDQRNAPSTEAGPSTLPSPSNVSHFSLPPAYASRVSIVPAEAPFEELATLDTTTPVAPLPDLGQAVADAVSTYLSGDEYLQKLRETVREEVGKEVEKLEKSTEKLERPPSEAPVPAPFTAPPTDIPEFESLETKIAPSPFTYAIYCNSCEGSIKDVHYHCGCCDRGDYDLCKSCVARGIHCKDSTHWLIKRVLSPTGVIVSSTTESVSQKDGSVQVSSRRTCNCCVVDLPGKEFVTCKVCEDYDVCLQCHTSLKHGHNPSHEFVPATPETMLAPYAVSLLAPGRALRHYAICDGCDKQIYGVRNKCLNCPDWDYCASCVSTASENHPKHRFVPIYEPLPVGFIKTDFVRHFGVYCDGPMCADKTNRSWIVGDRYKCAVCPDTDFCASCEASPVNPHNASHPLIKLKTPVRNVHVTTMEDQNSDNILGDVPIPVPTTNAATQVQTVAEVKPVEEPEPPFENVEEYLEKTVPVIEEEKVKPEVEPKVRAGPESEPVVPEPLQAHFVRDTIPDGYEMIVGEEFTQTWILNNSGSSEWPAGVSVQFVCGDEMFRNEVSSVNATVTSTKTPPGHHAAFTVNLKAPFITNRRLITYWRLVGPDGTRFGDKLWCEIQSIEKPKEDKMEQSVLESKDEFEDVSEHANDGSQASSQMIFPKLPVESPVASTENLVAGVSLKGEIIPVSAPMSTTSTGMGDDESEVDVGSLGDEVESFLTDDEYDVLDASDEEAFEECEKMT